VLDGTVDDPGIDARIIPVSRTTVERACSERHEEP